MNKLWTFIIGGLLIGGAFAMGYSFGVGYAVGLCVDKSLLAAKVLFDINLNGKTKQIALQFPEILARIDQDTKDKLGINETDYYRNQMNKTITDMNNIKYPHPDFTNQLKGGLDK